MGLFEALMLICFGIGWPISIVKSLRTKKVIGKSPLFMAVVCIGYISGIVYKITHTLDWVIFLYGLNLLMISLDIYLYLKYLPKSTVPPSAGREKYLLYMRSKFIGAHVFE